MHDYGLHCRPGLVRLLEAIGLDAEYVRAEGDLLWQRRGGRLVEVLDLVGGYGANLFGHHHPELVQEAARLLREQVPVFVQGSVRTGAARLAGALRERLGDYLVIQTNSGAETVEAALKHAYLERERPLFWAVAGGFHGKTLGAVQLTGSYKEPFEALGFRVRFLDPDDPADWEAAAQDVDEVAAAFVEPVLGEGGVRALPAAFVAWLSATCRDAGIPLVVDEIQSGMGRTGTFLASEQIGLEPDYLCLSKALGGGLAKIGALLIRRERFVEEFSVIHTSTFSEDGLSSGIALKALEILHRDDLPARCAEKGAYLVERLDALRRRFPEVVAEARGRGLMVGFELRDQRDSPSNILRLVAEHDYLGGFAAAYLLNVHNIRVAPTLSNPCTLRIQPSAYITEARLDRFVDAAASLCEAIQAQDAGHLVGFQMGRAPSEIVEYQGTHPFKREQPRTARRVAFLGHLIEPSDLTIWDPSLKVFSGEELERYLEKAARVLSPKIFDRVHIRSRTGEELHLSCICLVLSSHQIERAFRGRDYEWIVEKIEEAVVLAREAGCQIIGLGGYSPILTGNCKRLTTTGIALTSGNSLTAGMGIVALKEAALDNDIDLAQARLAVIGAHGNISSTYALMMAPLVAELVLIVRNLASPALKALVEEIYGVNPHVKVSIFDSVEAIRDCSLVVAASNSARPLIYPRHLNAEPVVICDISIPHDVSSEVLLSCPNVTVIQGGVVRLPFNDDFVIGGIPLEAGHIFACLAETILMGFGDADFEGSIGPITPDGVETTLKMAQAHGFTLGRLKTERSF